MGMDGLCWRFTLTHSPLHSPTQQTTHDGRIYTLNITCGAEYPEKVRESGERKGMSICFLDGSGWSERGWRWRSFLHSLSHTPTHPHHPSQTNTHNTQPPEVAFLSKVNMACVGPTGAVDPRAFPTLGAWRRAFTLERVLSDLRAEMASPANRRLPQPPEGSTYQ
jgi:ubiquitin-protein ligase